MAKKQKTEEVTVKTPEVKKVLTTKKWEIKDRTYFLKTSSPNEAPVSFLLQSRGLMWFDEEKGYEREVMYCPNQKTVFVDEMKGDLRMEHVIFRDGVLTVPKQKVMLQKLLSIYHPKLNKKYEEFDSHVEAVEDLVDLNLEVDALVAARGMDIDMAEAIMRVELGSEVSKMTSKEIKRDLLLYAKQNPVLFLELMNDDNIALRNVGIKATEMGLLKLSNDQRTFLWGSNDRKLMNVPFDEHPYTALAAWFKTDEGMEIYANIEKQLK